MAHAHDSLLVRFERKVGALLGLSFAGVLALGTPRRQRAKTLIWHH
jgi:hypothetical protein